MPFINLNWGLAQDAQRVLNELIFNIIYIYVNVIMNIKKSSFSLKRSNLNILKKITDLISNTRCMKLHQIFHLRNPIFIICTKVRLIIANLIESGVTFRETLKIMYGIFCM